jgi:uncharacterized FAD-dependent dehydrogenase
VGTLFVWRLVADGTASSPVGDLFPRSRVEHGGKFLFIALSTHKIWRMFCPNPGGNVVNLRKKVSSVFCLLSIVR